MITYKSRLSKKEAKELRSIMGEMIDPYSDFYLTKNNLRLFIKENIEILFESLNKGDKVAYGEEGIAIVTGFSDNSPRKYLKLLVNKPSNVQKLLKVIYWNLNCDLWVKIKKNNPLRTILEKNGFRFKGDRGREILFVRKGAVNVRHN